MGNIPAPVPQRDIRTVTLEIRTLHRQAQQILLGYAIEIGRRLVEAKEMLPHGAWGDWLKNEVEFSQSSAQNFMRIFEEYGANQLGLFGPEANSQTLGNLPYTKALRLLALPAEEREDFAREHDVEHLSTRELEQAIRERDEARREAEAAKQASVHSVELAEALEEAKRKAEEAEEEKVQLERELAVSMAEEETRRAELADLERDLEELRSRPVEVAVEAADPQELEAARKEAAAAAKKEAEEALKKKIDAAEQKRKAAEQKLAGLEEQKKQAEERAKALEQQGAEARASMEAELRREREAAEAKIVSMQKALRVAGSSDIQIFGVYFEAAKENINRMMGCLKKLQNAGATADHNRLLDALKALARASLDGAPKAMEEK
jgi:myosin heavy subunit